MTGERHPDHQDGTPANSTLVLSRLSHYIQPPNRGHKYWPRLFMFDATVSAPTASGYQHGPAALDQLPDVGCSLTGRQPGQAAPQATNYLVIARSLTFLLFSLLLLHCPLSPSATNNHWIAAWQV